jgi:hypothetical protein
MCIDTPLAAALGLDGARPRPQSLVRSLNEGGAWTGRGSWRWSRRRAPFAAAREPLDHRDLYRLLSFVVQAHAHRWESAAAPKPARAALFHRPQPLQAKLKERLTAAMKGFAQNDVMPSRHTWPGSSNERLLQQDWCSDQARAIRGSRGRLPPCGRGGRLCQLSTFCLQAFCLQAHAHGGNPPPRPTSTGNPFPPSATLAREG